MADEQKEELTELENKVLGVKFSVPKMITVEDQLRYYGVTGHGGDREALFLRLWDGVKMLASAWESKALPNLNADLSKVSDPAVASVVVWAGSTLMAHVTRMETPEKN